MDREICPRFSWPAAQSRYEEGAESMHSMEGVTPGKQNQILGMSTVAFTVCFAVWTIFSILGVQIKQELGLSDTQFGLLAGTPILTGALSRIFLGIWTDQYGGRIVYFLTMIFAAVATFLLSYVPSRSASPMSRNGIRRKNRAPRSGFSAPAMWGPQSPSLSRRSSSSPSAGKWWPRSGPSHLS